LKITESDLPSSIIFLGTSSAVPCVERGFSCIAVETNGETILLDCGDGALRNILKFDIDVRNISNILITHNHSDHLSGLTQLIETMSIKRRTSPLNVYGTSGLKEYFGLVEKITHVAFNKTFSLSIHELTSNQRLSLSSYNITTFGMDHTLPCLGYRIETGGSVLSFTGDTQPCDSLKALGEGSSILIHEASYLQRDLQKARKEKHSTPREAAEDALRSGAEKLIMTHVNESVAKPEEMISEASRVFARVSVAHDGFRLKL
jgi:ribonuclease Z